MDANGQSFHSNPGLRHASGALAGCIDAASLPPRAETSEGTARQNAEFQYALTAPGRSAEIDAKTDVYGWLMGSWEFDVRYYSVDVSARGMKGGEFAAKRIRSFCQGDEVTMSNENKLREQLIELLKSGNAHADFELAVKDMPFGLRGTRPDGAAHSPWEILEHLRIAQWDILEFTRNAKHVSPDFPTGYWPDKQIPPDEKSWDRSANAFRADLSAMAKLIEDESTDLFAPIPHGDGQTVLREALVLADHNAYHVGELILLRRLLGAWH